jgi:hypothetical protein
MLDNQAFYREYMVDDESTTGLQRFLGRFRRSLFWQTVPFYLEDDITRLLVIINDSMIGLFHKSDGLIAAGDNLYVCGTTMKNPFPKEFPDAEYAITRGKSIDDIPLAVSDDLPRLGSSSHESRAALLDIAAGYFCIAAGASGEFLLFFWTTIAHQKGYELIFNLFT